METIEAIQTRRSIPKVQETQPSRELIEKVIEVAQWAPNHYHTEPWSFEVLTGAGRDKLGKAYGRINIEELGPEAAEEEKVLAREKGFTKARRAPVIIVVKVQPSEQKNVIFVEEVAATACAVQNMLLAAHSIGLGAMWRTGKPAYHPIMKETFGVTGEGLVLGFIYIGISALKGHPRQPKKRPLDEVVKWVDEA